MGFDHNSPKRAKFSDPTCGQAAVRWDDAEEVQRWFEAMEEAVRDLRGAARDRVRRKRGRVLSRHEAKRQVGESSKRSLSLLKAGEAGWRGRLGPRDPDPAPGEGSREDDPPFSSSRPITPDETVS